MGLYDRIVILSSATGEEITSLDVDSMPTALAWNTRLNYIVASFNDGSIKFWNTGTQDSKSDSQFGAGDLSAYHKIKAASQLFKHADLADKAEKNSRSEQEQSVHLYAALFHRACVMLDDPEQALAWDLLHDAHQRWIHDGDGASIVLPSFVDLMLSTPRGEKMPNAGNSLSLVGYQDVVNNRDFRTSNVRPLFDQSILKLSSDQSWATSITLAFLQYRLKEYLQAIDTLSKVDLTENELRHPIHHGLLSVCYEKIGDNDSSIEHRQKMKHLMKSWETDPETFVSKQSLSENEEQLSEARIVWDLEQSQRFYAEIEGQELSEHDQRLLSKQSRGLGLPRTDWPVRSRRSSYSGGFGLGFGSQAPEMGGGVF